MLSKRIKKDLVMLSYKLKGTLILRIWYFNVENNDIKGTLILRIMIGLGSFLDTRY
jgi:hypothetical protein